MYYLVNLMQDPAKLGQPLDYVIKERINLFIVYISFLLMVLIQVYQMTDGPFKLKRRTAGEV